MQKSLYWGKIREKHLANQFPGCRNGEMLGNACNSMASNKGFLKNGCQHITSEKRKERAFLSQDFFKKDKYKCLQRFLDVLN